FSVNLGICSVTRAELRARLLKESSLVGAWVFDILRYMLICNVQLGCLVIPRRMSTNMQGW
ncbi:hypothetical protein LINPERPRIM_LOCUS34110, partial [Linum perenne]